MKIRLLGCTSLGHSLNRDEVLAISGKEANICYTERSIDEIFSEPDKDSIGRAVRTLASGHHSIADHVFLNLGISGIPKILAMVLNNEGVYATSEKSARYTQMKPTPREQEKYDKWLKIFRHLIWEEYGERLVYYYEKIPAKKAPEERAEVHILKLAQENARYMISVFTPTIMGHSLSIRQLSYIHDWFSRFIQDAASTPFNNLLKANMSDFISEIKPYLVEEIKDMKNRELSLFDKRNFRYEEFGECYSINYKGTFAQLAQAHRHRTLRYKMSFLPHNEYYVPKLIEDREDLKPEWIEDISSLGDVFPQGMLIMINERGTYEDFMQKCSERLCGCAQLEIALQTQDTARRYAMAVKDKYPEIYDILLPYCTKARCQNGWHCVQPCVWGAKEAFTRKC